MKLMCMNTFVHITVFKTNFRNQHTMVGKNYIISGNLLCGRRGMPINHRSISMQKSNSDFQNG